jgi:hypothetical protein
MLASWLRVRETHTWLGVRCSLFLRMFASWLRVREYTHLAGCEEQPVPHNVGQLARVGKNPGFKKKNPAQWVFLVFFGFFAQKRGF